MLTKIIYMVHMESSQTGRQLGNCLFERRDTAQVYANIVSASGVKVDIIARMLNGEGPEAMVFKEEVALAS